MGNKTVDERKELTRFIIDIEQDMFASVQTSELSSCQENLKTFRVMRWMNHSTHGDEFLDSYFQDLVDAQQEGRNLMTEKYAIIQGLIPSDVTETMESVIYFETQWLGALKDRYPNLLKRFGGFKPYFEAELQVISEKSLDLYHKEIIDGVKAGRNLVQERYENLYRYLGHNSLEEANAKGVSV